MVPSLAVLMEQTVFPSVHSITPPEDTRIVSSLGLCNQSQQTVGSGT